MSRKNHELTMDVVYDEPQPCPYLPDREARMPLRLPTRMLSGAEVDRSLAEGDRRHGPLLYRPTCGACKACEAIRIDLTDFEFSASQRRVLRKGDAALDLLIGAPSADEERLALYHRHKRERGLKQEEGPGLDMNGYQTFMVRRCQPAFELSMVQGDRLVGVALSDRGETSLSMVYFYWDPDLHKLSLGTYCILKHVELCRAWGLRYLYLGLYVSGNVHMEYKAGFRPHERLMDGVWRRFEEDTLKKSHVTILKETR